MTLRFRFHAAAVVVVASLLLVVVSTTLAQTTAPVQPIVRTPRYPLKTARTLVSDAQVKQARENVKKYASARKLADDVIKVADGWVAMDDAATLALITSADVPRAFAVSAVGCPACGGKIIEKGGGDYGWIMDARQPFKLKCPVDGTVYPSNDYAKYYTSGFKDKSGWDTDHVDDGWGWTDPKTGQKFWFVAYYNHWMWHKHLVPGIKALGDAYLLTGDKRYAHKAALMLHRVAEVYPAMDHESQSRYGQMQRARGQSYPGKVVNHIWEAGLVQNLADGYDAVWETIDADADLQRATGKSGEQIRAFIEANVLEDAIDAIFAGKIRGNFGMHQRALVGLGLARQYGEQDKWFDGLLDEGGPDVAMSGLRFALYNLVYRDGAPNETSPGYNFLWVSSIASYGDQLHRTGRDVFALPKTRRFFDAVLDLVNIGKFTPALGDTSNVMGGLIGQSADVYQTAFRHYHDPAYARFLASFGATGEAGFKTVDSLFDPPIEAETTKAPPRAPRLLDGYGLGILNDPADSISASLYYGLRAGHGHYDRLGFELFANGQPIMPDLGYPDAMNDYVPGIYTWSKNTIAHNTVTVDGSRQLGNAPGVVRLFATAPFARVIDVDAPGTYPQCSAYRRALIMIDAPAGGSYFVDVFTVAGGKQHDYSLHGPPGSFDMIGGTWTDPASRGTLAGENVALGTIYDDPALGAPGYKGGFNGYHGSGFQHLFNARNLTAGAGEWVAQWRHAKDENSRLRIRVLDQPAQQMILADAQVSPVKNRTILKYLLARKTGEGVKSTFASVIEPFAKEPLIERASRVQLEPATTAIAIERNGATDLVVYGDSGTKKSWDDRKIETDAAVAVVTVDAGGKACRVFFAGGTFLACNGRRFEATVVAPLAVGGTEPGKSLIRVDNAPAALDPSLFVGRVAHFANDLRRTAHPIVAATRDGSALLLTAKDDLFVGRAIIDKVNPSSLTTRTALPLSPIYNGVELCTDDLRRLGTVKQVSGGTIELSAPLGGNTNVKTGDKVWLVNVGAGDVCELPSVFHWTREETK